MSGTAKRLTALALTTAALALLGGAHVPAAERVVLARVDGEPVTLAELKADFERRHQGHMSILADELVVRDFLEATIKRRLFIQEGRRLALQEGEQLRSQVDAERQNRMTRWLYESEVVDRLEVTEAAIDAAVEQARRSYEIFRVETDARGEALRAHQRIADGEPPEAVARELSTARSRLRGGLEGIDWGRADPALETALWASEEGQLLGPIETETGWNVVRVVRRRELEAPGHEPDRVRVEAILRSRQHDATRAQYLDGLRERYGAQIDESLLEPAVIAPLVERRAATPRSELDLPSVQPRVVARWNGGSIELDAFVASIRAQSYLELRPGQRRRQARQLLDNQLDEAMLELEAERRWSDAPDELRMELRGFEDDLVFRTLLADVVFGEVTVSDEEARAYLDEHREDYVEAARLRFAVALLESEADAAAFLAERESGRPFAELARERSRDPQTAARGGESGWIEEGQAIPELRGAPFELAAGSFGGPLEIEGGWLVYEVLDRREAQPFADERALAAVRDLLIQRGGTRRMSEWEEQLRAVAEIKLLDKGIRRATAVLAREREERRLETAAPRTPPANPHGKGS